jgi:2'-5' RNA ligase
VTAAGESAEHVRAFAALDLQPPWRERIGQIAHRLGESLPGLRLVRPEAIHLTLRFYGACRARQIETLRARLEAAAAEAPATDAVVQGLGLFPERGKARVLFLAMDVSPSVRVLQEACEAAALDAGLPAESRPFVAHVTLGRWREPAPRPTLPPVEIGLIRLDTLTLYRSDLHPAGAVHVPLCRFRLAG